MIHRNVYTSFQPVNSPDPQEKLTFVPIPPAPPSMAPKSQLVAAGQQRRVQGIIIPPGLIAPALVGNALVPNNNQPVMVGGPLKLIQDLAPVANPPMPIKNQPAVTKNPPVPTKNPAPGHVAEPHFPGHFPEVLPVEDNPAMALVEVMGIIPLPETSSLLSLFGN